MTKKIDSRLSDTRRIKSSGNVFVDLGFDPAEAKVMALRAEVMIRMEQHLKAQGWTQAEAAKRLGITQPRVSRLHQGKVAGLQPGYAADAGCACRAETRTEVGRLKQAVIGPPRQRAARSKSAVGRSATWGENVPMSSRRESGHPASRIAKAAHRSAPID